MGKGLTPRELEALTLIALGFTHRDVAHKMGRSVSTVRSHFYSAVRKLDRESPGEAVAFAIKTGLVHIAEGQTRSSEPETSSPEPRGVSTSPYTILNTVASVYARVGRVDLAKTIFEQRLLIEKRPKERADILSELGLVYRRLGELDLALIVYQETLDMFLSQGRVSEAANVHCGIGMTHEQRAIGLNEEEGQDTSKELSLAEESYGQMASLSQTVHDDHVKGKLFHCLGRIKFLKDRRDTDLILANYDQAAKLFEREGRLADLNNVLMDKARALIGLAPDQGEAAVAATVKAYEGCTAPLSFGQVVSDF